MFDYVVYTLVDAHSTQSQAALGAAPPAAVVGAAPLAASVELYMIYQSNMIHDFTTQI